MTLKTITTGPLLRCSLAAALVALSLGLACPGAQAQTWTNGHYVVDQTIVVEPIAVSVVRGGRPRAVIVIAPNLAVEDSVKRNEISGSMPRLRDAWLRALDIYVDNADLRAPVDITMVSELLQKSTDSMFGAGFAKILISYATIRRL